MMRAIVRIAVECHYTQDDVGSDDLDFVLDGRHIGRFEIKEREILTGTASHALYGDGTWVIQPGSRLTVYEVDLVDGNDVILDHTFGDDVNEPWINFTGQAGMYDFQIRIDELPEG